MQERKEAERFSAPKNLNLSPNSQLYNCLKTKMMNDEHYVCLNLYFNENLITLLKHKGRWRCSDWFNRLLMNEQISLEKSEVPVRAEIKSLLIQKIWSWWFVTFCVSSQWLWGENEQQSKWCFKWDLKKERFFLPLHQSLPPPRRPSPCRDSHIVTDSRTYFTVYIIYWSWINQ